MRLILFALILFGWSSTAQQEPRVLGFVMPEGKSRITIPVEIHNNLVVMPVVVNGQLPMKFILDTGVRTAILTEKSYSDILGIPYSRQFIIAGPGNVHTITAYVANDIKLSIPAGLTGDGHALLVLEKDYLELRNYLGAEVHGIIGYELFSRFIIQINYQDKVVEIIDPAKFKPRKKFQALPITIEDTKPFLTTTAQTNGKKSLKFLVDTGASFSLLLDPQSDPSIQVPEKHITTIIGRALGGEITGKIGRVASLDLGKYTLNNVITNFPDVNSYLDTLKSSVTKRNGSIGSEVLSRFTVIFDYSHGTIYLKKNAVFKKPFNNDLSGLTIKAKGARLKTFEIVDVRKNSVADLAGFKKGDIVFSVNGNSAANFTLNELNNVFNTKPGKKVVLEVERGGQKVKKTVTLTEDI
jgi:predicted aspartyl protease